MDSGRFDALAKTLALGADRRRVLRGLAGAAVAALAGRFGPEHRRRGQGPAAEEAATASMTG